MSENKKYKGLLDNISDVVYEINCKGEFTYVNKAGLDLFAYSVNEVIGRFFVDFVYEKDKKKILSIHEKNITKKKSRVHDLQIRMVSKSGDVKLVKLNAELDYDEKGVFKESRGVARDITEKTFLLEAIEQSKSHYKQVIDTIQDPICVIGKNHKIQSCNIVFAEKVGLEIKKIKGLSCSEVLPHFENSLFKNHCKKDSCDDFCTTVAVFKEGKVVLSIEESRDEQGHTHFHRITVYPAKNKKQQVEKVVLIIKNITEAIQTKQRIEDLNMDLEKKVTERTYELHKINKELAKVLS